MYLLLSMLLSAPIYFSANPNYCIDVPAGIPANNTKLQLYKCNGTTAQDFTVMGPVATPAPTSAASVSSAASATSSSTALVDPNTPSKEGYTAVFSDEFNGNSLDLTKWNLITDGSGGGNNELEYYTPFPANHTVANSHLTIHAIEATFLGQPWTSAKLNTLGLFDFTYGYVEFRAKIPNGQGAWPALWLMPKDNLYGVWPTSGEIDVMEILGGAPNTLYSTLHYGKNWPNQQQIGGTTTAVAGTDFSQDFHTYAVDWQQDHMDFYLDGKNFYSVASSAATWNTDIQGAPVSTGSNGWPFNQPFYLIMNLAVGGSWPGAPSSQFTAFDLVVDYARVYKKN